MSQIISKINGILRSFYSEKHFSNFIVYSIIPTIQTSSFPIPSINQNKLDYMLPTFAVVEYLNIVHKKTI